MDRLDGLADGGVGVEYVKACRLAVNAACDDLMHHCNPRPYLESLIRIADFVAEQIGSIGVSAIDTLHRMLCVFTAHSQVYPAFTEHFVSLIHVKKLDVLQRCLDRPELYRSSKRLLRGVTELMVREHIDSAAGRFLVCFRH